MVCQNSSLELPPALQNILNQHNSIYFGSFNAAIDLDDTLESDGIININRSLSLSPVKKTKEYEILQIPDLEVQIAVRVRFTDLYVHPIPLFRLEITYKTFPASFVCSRLKFDFGPAESSAHGTATFYNPCSKLSYSTSL